MTYAYDPDWTPEQVKAAAPQIHHTPHARTTITWSEVSGDGLNSTKHTVEIGVNAYSGGLGDVDLTWMVEPNDDEALHEDAGLTQHVRIVKFSQYLTGPQAQALIDALKEAAGAQP